MGGHGGKGAGMDPNSKQCKQLRRSGHGLSTGVPSALRTCISAKSPTCAVAARRDVRAGGLAGGLWVDGALWVHGHCGGIIPSAICPTRNRRGTSTSQRYGPGEAERGRRVAFARPGRCISKRSEKEQGHPKGRLRDWCSYDCHRGPTWLGFGRLGGPLGPCWVPMERSGQPDRGGRQRAGRPSPGLGWPACRLWQLHRHTMHTTLRFIGALRVCLSRERWWLLRAAMAGPPALEPGWPPSSMTPAEPRNAPDLLGGSMARRWSGDGSRTMESTAPSLEQLVFSAKRRFHSRRSQANQASAVSPR